MLSMRTLIAIAVAFAAGVIADRALVPPTLIVKTGDCPPCFQKPCDSGSTALGVAMDRLSKCETKLSKLPVGRGYVEIGTPTVLAGTISTSGVLHTVQAQTEVLRGCYAATLARDASIRGRMTVKFIVNQDGWVQTAASDTAHFDDPRLEVCITHELRTWTFPKPSSRIAVVLQAFDFEAEAPHPLVK